MIILNKPQIWGICHATAAKRIVKIETPSKRKLIDNQKMYTMYRENINSVNRIVHKALNVYTQYVNESPSV